MTELSTNRNSENCLTLLLQSIVQYCSQNINVRLLVLNMNINKKPLLKNMKTAVLVAKQYL